MPITTTKLSKNKTSRQCFKHRRLVTLSIQEQHPFLGIAMDRGSVRKTGAGLNPRQDHVIVDETKSLKSSNTRFNGIGLHFEEN